MRLILLTLIILFTASDAISEPERLYTINYEIAFKPDKGYAEVSLRIPNSRWLTMVDFNVEKGQYFDAEANGEFSEVDDRWHWRPPAKNARLTYRVRVNKNRGDEHFDAYMTADWVLMRGDNLVPPARVRQSGGARSDALISFVMPPSWTSVNGGWQRLEASRFKFDESKHSFARPVGWLVAGKLSTRRETMAGTQLSVSGPRGHRVRPMELTVFMGFVWPELARLFDPLPTDLLIVSAAEPMWRGGLSGPNSLYLHSDRPLVDEDGTSTLIHELVHVLSGISGARYADWIAEGIAEYYSVELLYRSGGLTAERRQTIYSRMQKRSKQVKSLHVRASKGDITAKAVLMFRDLDQEIQAATEGRSTLDDVVRQLRGDQDVSWEGLVDAVKKVTGAEPQTLQGPLFQPPQ